MGKYVRKTLIVSAFLLCLFALTLLGASAAYTPTETGTAQADAVASVTDGTTTYYYASLDTAIADAISNTDDTNVVTVLKNATVDSAIAITEQNITIQSADAAAPCTITFVAPSVSTAAFSLGDNVTLTFSNITWTGTGRFVHLGATDSAAKTTVNLNSGTKVLLTGYSSNSTRAFTSASASAGEFEINVNAGSLIEFKYPDNTTTRLGSSDLQGLFGFNANGHSKGTVNVYGAITHSVYWSDAQIEKGRSAIFKLGAGPTTVNIYDGAVITVDTNTTKVTTWNAVVCYDQAGSSLNVYGGTFNLSGPYCLAAHNGNKSSTTTIDGTPTFNIACGYLVNTYGSSATVNLADVALGVLRVQKENLTTKVTLKNVTLADEADALANNAVCRVGTNVYFSDFSAAVAAAAASGDTVSVLADCSTADTITLSNCTVNIVGVADAEGNYPTVKYTGSAALFLVSKDVTIKVDNIVFDSSKWLIELVKGIEGNADYGYNPLGTATFIFNNVSVKASSDIIMGYRGTNGTINLTIKGGKWESASYLMNTTTQLGGNGVKVVNVDFDDLEILAGLFTSQWKTTFKGTFDNVQATNSGTGGMIKGMQGSTTYTLTLNDCVLNAAAGSILHYGDNATNVYTFNATNTIFKNDGSKQLFIIRTGNKLVLNLDNSGLDENEVSLSTEGKNTLFYDCTGATTVCSVTLNLKNVNYNAKAWFGIKVTTYKMTVVATLDNVKNLGTAAATFTFIANSGSKLAIFDSPDINITYDLSGTAVYAVDTAERAEIFATAFGAATIHVGEEGDDRAYATALDLAFLTVPANSQNTNVYILKTDTVKVGALGLENGQYVTLIGPDEDLENGVDVTSTNVITLRRNTRLILKNIHYTTSYRLVAISDDYMNDSGEAADVAKGTEIRFELQNSKAILTGAIGIYTRNDMGQAHLFIIIDKDSTLAMENAAPNSLIQINQSTCAPGSELYIAGTLSLKTTGKNTKMINARNGGDITITVAPTATIECEATWFIYYDDIGDNSLVMGIPKLTDTETYTLVDGASVTLTYLSDAVAVSFGMLYRVGDTQEGAEGVVYFVSYAEALAKANGVASDVHFIGTTNFETDAAAIEAGMAFRVADAEGGKLGEVYFDSLIDAKAMASTTGKTVVYLQQLTQEEALAEGATVRLGEEVATGAIGQVFFFTLEEALFVAQNGQNVYILVTQNITDDVLCAPNAGITGVKVLRAAGFTGTMFNITAGTLTIANVEITEATAVFTLSDTGSLVIGDTDTTVQTLVHGTVSEQISSIIEVTAANAGSITLEADSSVGIDNISFAGTAAQIRVIHIAGALTGDLTLKGNVYAGYNGSNDLVLFPANDAEAGTGVTFTKDDSNRIYSGVLIIKEAIAGNVNISGSFYTAQGESSWYSIMLGRKVSGKVSLTNVNVHAYSNTFITTTSGQFAEIEIGQNTVITHTPEINDDSAGIVYFRGGRQILRVKDNATLVSGVKGSTTCSHPTFYFGGARGAEVYFEDEASITNNLTSNTTLSNSVLFRNDPAGFYLKAKSTVKVSYNKLNHNTGNVTKRIYFADVETLDLFYTVNGFIEIKNAEGDFIGCAPNLAQAVKWTATTNVIYVHDDLTETANTSIANKAIKIIGVAKEDGSYPTVTFTKSAFTLTGDAPALTVENLNLSGSNINFFVIGDKSKATTYFAGTATVTLNGVAFDWTDATGVVYAYCQSAGTITVNATDCVFNSSGNAVLNTKTADGTYTVTLTDCLMNADAKYSECPATAVTVTITYTSDAKAVWAGYLYRVGADEGGAEGTVYFKTLAAADAAEGDLTLELLRLIADTANYADDDAANAAKMLYRVGDAGGHFAWVYFSDEGEATIMARISGKEVVLLGITSIEAAIAKGAKVRLGGPIAAGQLDEHYFASFEAALAAAIAAGSTDIEIYFLVSGETIAATQTLSGVKLTLASATDTRQTLTMSANPAIKLDAGAHLVVANLAISVPDGFALIINADTAATVQLDLEAGALIDIAYAASSNAHGYLLKTQKSVPTGKILANIKEGATVRRVATTATEGNSQGLFQFRSDGNNCVAGSKITISGSIYFSLNYTASGCAPVVMLGNGGRIDIAFTETAYVELMHTGATNSTWSAVVCYEGNGASVHMTGATFKLGDNIALVGFNGASFTSADVIVDGVSIETDAAYIINDYAKPVGTANTSPITFRNMTLPKGKQLGINNALVNASLENMSFESAADAAAYGAALKVDALSGYYNMYAALKAVSDGGSILVLADHTQISQATASDKSFTLRSADGGSYKITGGFAGGNLGERLFILKGACNVTVQDLTIEANSRVFLFQSTTKGAPASLTLQNAKVTSLATGNGANAILCVGADSTEYFDLYIDAQSELGYRDVEDPSTLKPGRNYQVIFYYGSVTGDIRIDGHVYTHVYCNGSNVRYDAALTDSGNAYAPDAQYMIQIGNDVAHTFTGDIVITGRLTMKVVYAEADLNAFGVGAAHTAYAFYSYTAGAALFVADGAEITLELTNATANSGLAGFACGAVSNRTATYAPEGATALTGKLYYTGIAGNLAFQQKYEYNGEYVTVDGNYAPVYDKDLLWNNVLGKPSAQREYDIAEDLATLLTKLLGTTVTARDDTTITDFEILVGRVDRAVVNTYLPTVGANEYTILMVEGKLLLLAWQEDALLRGANDLYQILTLCLTDEGVIRIPAALLAGTHIANDKLLSDFTRPTGEEIRMSGAQYVGDSSLQVLYTGAGIGTEAYNAYVATLLAEGYTLVWENSIEGSCFKMLEHDGKGIALYVAYNAYTYADYYNDKYENEAIADTLEGRFLTDFLANGFTKCIRVISAPISAVITSDPGISTPNPTYTKVTDTTLVTLGIPSGQVGMGYVIMLEDGRFVVIDGGRNPDDNTDFSEEIWSVLLKLYETAYGTAPTAERPIHVAAWYLTHAHGDHYGAFKALLTTLSKQERTDLFKMDYMIGNLPAPTSMFESMDWGPYEDDLNSMKASVKGGFKFLKVHTGQKLYLANVEMEVLLTYEDHLPCRIINTNDTNTVIRMTVHNAQPDTVASQILFLGDSWRYSSRILCAMYGEYLQTEILQLAHHGNIGCEKLLYEIISPKAVLFPHCESGFRGWVWDNTASKTNGYALTADRYLVLEAESVRYVWAAPGGVHNTLVFTPTGPDYKNVYNLLTGEKVVYSTDMTEKPLYITRGTDVISINVVWGDFSFTYQFGTWNPETHEYDGGNGWVADGDSTVDVENAGDIEVAFSIAYANVEGYDYFVGTLTDENGESVDSDDSFTLSTYKRRSFEFDLTSTSLPDGPLDGVAIGSITVSITTP